MTRPSSMPTYANYDGTFSRLCDFLGIQTGSTEGNYEAVKKDMKRVIAECAAAYGTRDINSAAVHGKLRLTFVAPEVDGPEKQEESQELELA